MPTPIDACGQVIARDPWHVARQEPLAEQEQEPGAEQEPVAEQSGDVAWLLPLEALAGRADALAAQDRPFGLLLGPADEPDSAVPWFDRVAMIAVDFPAFTDGRGYSTARLLRQRLGWTGPLRAVGDVGRDQLFALRRCGFDSFLLNDSDSPEDAAGALGDFRERYQAAVDTGPLFDRRSSRA